MKFEELNIHEDLKKAIRDAGYIDLTPIQEGAIPPCLEGKDVTGLAQTGTGKTLAFLLPIIHKILNENLPGPAAMILAPTRELTLQISEEAKKLLKYTNKTVATIIGGTDYKKQEDEIEAKAEIVIATPGRLIDHIRSGNLKLNTLNFFVLDEADRMLDMGFIKDIRYVMRQCPASRQVMMFSATLSYYVMRLASDYLKDPIEIKIAPEKIVTDNIDQKIIHLGREEKLPYLVNLIQRDNIEGLGIIFTNMKIYVDEIVRDLRRFGIPSMGLSSMLDQKKRIRLLKDFKLGKYKYMIATDVASRGIDIDNIDVVYNFDLPSDTENYVHRIGRTARAGRTGRAVSFCSERDYVELEKIEAFIGHKLDAIEVNEDFLKYPAGEFKPFHPEKELKIDSEKPTTENRNHKKKGDFKKRDKDSSGGFKKKNKFDKQIKKRVNPVDEAKEFIKKADSVLETEKPIKSNPKFEKKKRKELF